MKLVIAIVRDDFCEMLQDVLTEKGFRYTKLASTGGFLRKGNTTLLVGIDDSKLDDVLKAIGESCKTRSELIAVSPIGITQSMIVPPIEVVSGGATVFVVDVVKFEQF